ncbi:Lsr2 family protein [Pseudarthrobacter oxydans]|uniref:histone-like nucleoid-structuring protein Lsr2 n=1 Tax=Pseudarthrobacter oxydans TaxID=1671 RepID=UPI003D2E71C4
MATRTVIELIDDLDGSEATETVRFALDGTEYEIDLTEENAGSLRGLLARFVDAGRQTAGGITKRRPVVRHLPPAADTKAIRAWAAENGVEVNSRGRIKDDVVQRYLAALS